MIFDKMADVIIKRARLFLVLWIVVLLVSVPFIMKSSSVLQYDMSKMNNSVEMESQKG